MFASNKIHPKPAVMNSIMVVIFFMVLGCSMVGSIVPTAQRLNLVETNVNESMFKSGDLNVIYSYDFQGTLFKITGKTTKPQGLDSFNLRLLFLDAEGKVLQQSIIATVGFREDRRASPELNFTKTLQLPTNTAGISFSYSGISRTGNNR